MKTREEIREMLGKWRAEQRTCLVHDALWLGLENSTITLEWVLK